MLLWSSDLLKGYLEVKALWKSAFRIGHKLSLSGVNRANLCSMDIFRRASYRGRQPNAKA